MEHWQQDKAIAFIAISLCSYMGRHGIICFEVSRNSDITDRPDRIDRCLIKRVRFECVERSHISKLAVYD